MFEIKKTLKTQLQDALDHLDKITRAVDIKKDHTDKYLPGGVHLGAGINGGYDCNPLMGVIGCSYELNQVPDQGNDLQQELSKVRATSAKVNIVASLGGSYICLAEASTNNLHAGNPWPSNPHYVVPDDSWNYEQVIARVFGYLNNYLGGFCGRRVDCEAYFFNDHLA